MELVQASEVYPITISAHLHARSSAEARSYVGEIILHSGPPLLALSVLPVTLIRYIVFLPPIFSYFLIRYATGVPMLEERVEKLWGGDEGWRKYRDGVSVMIPWPWGLGKGKA